MKSIQEYRDEHDLLKENLLQMTAINMYSYDELDEMINNSNTDGILDEGKIRDFFKKKLPVAHEKGLFHYFKGMSTGVARLIMAGVKGDKEKMKAIIKTVKREDVVDFLFKLDSITFGVITHVIERIDAITGWDLEHEIQKIIKNTKVIAKNTAKALDTIKNSIKSLVKNDKDIKLALDSVKSLENLVKLT